MVIFAVAEMVLNLLSFFYYGIDKRKAIKNRWRISEKTLLIISLIAPLGALLGMYVFRHKTQKLIFKILVPFFLVLHIVILLFVFNPF